MRFIAIIRRGRIAAGQIRQAIAYKDSESDYSRSNIIFQILLGIALAVSGILLGYFFPIR